MSLHRKPDQDRAWLEAKYEDMRHFQRKGRKDLVLAVSYQITDAGICPPFLAQVQELIEANWRLSTDKLVELLGVDLDELVELSRGWKEAPADGMKRLREAMEAKV